MAKSIVNSAQTLPRFLLPKLSWQTRSSIPPHTVRALNVAANSNGKSTRDVCGQQISNGARSIGNGSKTRTSILQEPSCRRAFHATPRQSRDHHFDTLKFVQRLRDEGFTEPQAVAMMKVLSDVIEERYCIMPLSFFLRNQLTSVQHPKPNSHNGSPRRCRPRNLHPKS